MEYASLQNRERCYRSATCGCRLGGQSAGLICAELQTSIPDLFSQDPIFRDEIINDLLLMSFNHPAMEITTKENGSRLRTCGHAYFLDGCALSLEVSRYRAHASRGLAFAAAHLFNPAVQFKTIVMGMGARLFLVLSTNSF